MTKIIRHIFITISLILIFSGCKEDDLSVDSGIKEKNMPVSFIVEIEPPEATRSIDDESKIQFEIDELIHIIAVYECEFEGVNYTERKYGVIKYGGNGLWNPLSDSYALIWPNEATRASFKAYYMYGSNGIFTENTMPAKLLSDYGYEEIPMSAEVTVRYGEAVRLPMKRMFAHLTLTELKEGVSDQLWFSLPDNSLNNAFLFEFKEGNETTGPEIIPTFTKLADSNYKDKDGNPIVYVNSKNIGSLPEGTRDMTGYASYFLEPRIYQQFNVLYPRGRDTYTTYLSYDRDLSKVLMEMGENESGELRGNGRYVFSILKSLGVIIENDPENEWDTSDQAVEVDVEEFLRAVNSGASYFKKISENDSIQILEQTLTGSKLLTNVDFNYTYYDMFEPGSFLPSVRNVFNGNYHYIHHLGCPLFYQNNGSIINLGIKNVDTSRHPLVSSENLVSETGDVFDNSYNGIITSRNYGIINNVRVTDINMTVEILTSHPYDKTQEAHNVSLLIGENSGQGNISDLYLAGTMTLNVKNHEGEEIIPRIAIGGLAGQNMGRISNVGYIEEDGFELPEIEIINLCKGENGVYKIGGIAGNNTGTLDEILINSVVIKSQSSVGLESMIGGVVGECPSSTSVAPVITGCIVRGEISAGNVAPLTNLESRSYAGGIAGALNVQAYVDHCSISVGVTGSSDTVDNVEYAEGGAFGNLIWLAGYTDGDITTVACFGSNLEGPGYIGNFAGIVSKGYGWDKYSEKEISVKHFNGINNVGAER